MTSRVEERMSTAFHAITGAAVGAGAAVFAVLVATRGLGAALPHLSWLIPAVLTGWVVVGAFAEACIKHMTTGTDE